MFRHRLPRGRERIRRRADYEELRKFRTNNEFDNWWRSGEKLNWRINSRHPHVNGTVEYWQCAYIEGRRHTCSARLRITFDRDNRFVSVCRAKRRPHNHQLVESIPIEQQNEVHDIVSMEPYQMQSARVIHINVNQDINPT